MFLWYLICLERNRLHNILSLPGGTHLLGMSFRGTTEEVLDIYCAQLKYQETQPSNGILLSSFDVISKEYFPNFAHWMHSILTRGLSGISVDTYKQLALLIASATELESNPEDLSDIQWNVIGQFIREPRKASKDILGDNNAYPESKGRWGGQKGQREQCEKTIEIFRTITRTE